MEKQTRLLVVDDEWEKMGLKCLIDSMLEDDFYDIDYANSAAQAKRRLGAQEYSIVLSDIDMEKRGIGISLAEHIRDTYGIPVVFHSGNDEHRAAVEERGFEFYDKKDLCSTIERLKELKGGKK